MNKQVEDYNGLNFWLIKCNFTIIISDFLVNYNLNHVNNSSKFCVINTKIMPFKKTL